MSGVDLEINVIAICPSSYLIVTNSAFLFLWAVSVVETARNPSNSILDPHRVWFFVWFMYGS